MRKMLQKFTLIAVMALFTGSLFAQGTVTGKIKDDMTGDPLIGATVILDGTTTGATTDLDGVFTLDLPAGTQKIHISYVGFNDVIMDVNVANGETTKIGKVALEGKAIGLKGLDIIADRAKERQTPVAISNVSKRQLEESLGSRDLPMVMNNTPSVYATQQGGGAGDARINVRGFNQNNVAIMINGVPVNDMENGWVYWSNWDGVADATSSIQMQRGLSAINLATPSVGGTMNILTSPAEHDLGGSVKFEVGSGSFFKTSLSGHSGLINNKFAVSASVVKKNGQGVIDKTWTDAWAYYFGASYNINKNHRLELFVVGATQRHGQNLYKQNAAAYSADFAKNELGMADSAILAFPESDRGRLYNQNWGAVSESYTGQQVWNGRSATDRYNKGYINERENFYHKPLANLNWYAQWSKKITHFTTLYYSGGTGGGTGTYGKIQYNYDGPSRTADWDKTIAKNLDPEYGRQGIIRNSVNNQWTVGAISKVKVDFSENFKMQFGIDWRTAGIDHYREVRDLLGLTTYHWDGNEFDSEANYEKSLGDKIAYYNSTDVDWLGGYAQAEYTKDKFSIYGTLGYAAVKYGFTDHFHKGKDGGELTAVADWQGGYQFKGGANYNFSETFSAFVNAGLISKVPIFDVVINDRTGDVTTDPLNERFQSFEGGIIFTSIDDKLKIKSNLYYTKWLDRTLTRSIQITEDLFGTAFIKGLDQLHTGLEIEANYRPIKLIGIGGVASFAQWKYLNDVNADIRSWDDVSGDYVTQEVNVYTKDLKVGDAPQNQYAVWFDIFPLNGLKLQLIIRHNSNHYADFNPATRVDENDDAQVWKTPAYTVLDAHANYRLPLNGKLGVDIFFHAFNLANSLYVQDAVDNSAYNGYYGYDNRYTHTANSAEVFLGAPFTFNFGVKLSL